MTRRPMILSAFFFNPQGDHRTSWLHPHAPGHEVFGLDYYRDLAQAAERAAIDMLFVADHVAIWDSVASGLPHYANARLEPLTLLSALAGVTEHIGLVGTASTSYYEPYNLARIFASLDHISRGRAGWNVVTSAMDEEALNFGRDGNIEHANRYDRATEFLDAATALWDSWDDGAVLIDRATKRFADPARVRSIDHRGTHFTIRGPLNVPRSPQGYPLIMQAGSSEAGKELAAAYVDVQFAIVRTVEDGLSYRADMDARLARHGRTPDSFRIVGGVLPVVASSRAEARERQEVLDELMPDSMKIDLLSSWAGTDLSVYPADGPLPALPDEATFNGGRTALNRVKDWIGQGLSIREVARKIASSGAMPTVAGTATDVADQLEAWFVAGALDGYNLMFPLLPDDWTRFAETVMPDLQRRGLARRDYGPGTLRDTLGLARPANRFTPSAP